MTLSHGRGPLSPDPVGWFSGPVPDGVVYVEPHPRRVQATIGDRSVIDTDDVLLVHRVGRPLAYAFREGAVGDLPHEPEPEAPGYVQVPWDAADAWFEDGRRLVHYPPNPYHRVDCRPTRRRLRVELHGTTLVDTDDTIAVFETALAPRLYVRPELVRMDLLQRTDTSTYCNYKGHATYWAATIDGVVHPDVAWSYEETLPESTAITGCLSFYAELAEVTAELPAAVADLWPPSR